MPFHSAHLPCPGKDPTWYKPPQSQASAMSLTFESKGSLLMASITGGFLRGAPSLPRVRMEAKSKRKPSTCISLTQYLRESTISFCEAGWLQEKVFPHPE